MKIFIYYGNETHIDSRATIFLQKLEQTLTFADKSNTIVVRSPSNTKLNFMASWSDVLQYDDISDKKNIAIEMLQADLIIFVSPVFIHHVSAYMKLFLDNFASWGHTMPLIGKVGLPISSSNNNGDIKKISKDKNVYEYCFNHLISKMILNI